MPIGIKNANRKRNGLCRHVQLETMRRTRKVVTLKYIDTPQFCTDELVPLLHELLGVKWTVDSVFERPYLKCYPCNGNEVEL